MMSVAKRSAGDVAYLVRQGQKEVIEQEGSGRDYLILVVIAHYQPQKRCKSAPAFLAVLISQSKDRISLVADGGRGLTDYFRCR